MSAPAFKHSHRGCLQPQVACHQSYLHAWHGEGGRGRGERTRRSASTISYTLTSMWTPQELRQLRYQLLHLQPGGSYECVGGKAHELCSN